jgi:hypothetical protein
MGSCSKGRGKVGKGPGDDCQKASKEGDSFQSEKPSGNP